MPAAEAATFAALGDATRLALVRRLSDGNPRSIAALAADRRITRQAVAKHLRVLEAASLVRSTRSGREARYALRPETLDVARSYIDDVAAYWDAAIDRLKAHVEG